MITPQGPRTLQTSITFPYDINSSVPLNLSKGTILKLIKTSNPTGKELRMVDRLSYANQV